MLQWQTEEPFEKDTAQEHSSEKITMKARFHPNLDTPSTNASETSWGPYPVSSCIFAMFLLFTQAETMKSTSGGWTESSGSLWLVQEARSHMRGHCATNLLVTSHAERSTPSLTWYHPIFTSSMTESWVMSVSLSHDTNYSDVTYPTSSEFIGLRVQGSELAYVVDHILSTKREHCFWEGGGGWITAKEVVVILPAHYIALHQTCKNVSTLVPVMFWPEGCALLCPLSPKWTSCYCASKRHIAEHESSNRCALSAGSPSLEEGHPCISFSIQIFGLHIKFVEFFSM